MERAIELANWRFGGATDYEELHLHLVGDAYVILENIMVRENGTGANFVTNGTVHAATVCWTNWKHLILKTSNS